MRARRQNYVDATVWAALVAGALPWCRRCRTSCPGHLVTADAVEQLLVMPEPAEDVDTAPDYSSVSS